MLKILCFFLCIFSCSTFFGAFHNFFQGGFNGETFQEKKPSEPCLQEQALEEIEPYVEPIPVDPYPLLHEIEPSAASAIKEAILESLIDDPAVNFIKAQGVKREKRRQRILDIECGNGNISIALAHYLGPKTSIKGLDASQAHIDEARRRARSTSARFDKATLKDLSNIRSGFFDVIICRLHFLNSNNLEETINAISRLLKAGGKAIFIESLNLNSLECIPTFSVFEEVKNLIAEKLGKKGIQLDIRQDLISSLYNANFILQDVQFFHPVLKTSQEKSLFEMEIHEMKDSLLSEGRYTEEELNHWLEELKTREQNPLSIFSFYEVAMISATKV